VGLLQLEPEIGGRRKEMDSKTLVNRRTAIGAALVGASPLLFPGRIRAQGKAAPADPFVVLLKGLYQPVVRGPNLGLSAVDLSDGSYLTTKIYPVSGTPGNTNPNEAIGDFYVQFPTGDLCAYHIPGGSFAMRFTGNNVAFEPDGAGGQFLVGTFELDVIEGTGIYRSVVGGHNHMIDKLHFLAPGDGSGGLVEFCTCIVSGP
jgi:hypothetical protein